VSGLRGSLDIFSDDAYLIDVTSQFLATAALQILLPKKPFPPQTTIFLLADAVAADEAIVAAGVCLGWTIRTLYNWRYRPCWRTCIQWLKGVGRWRVEGAIASVCVLDPCLEHSAAAIIVHKNRRHGQDLGSGPRGPNISYSFLLAYMMSNNIGPISVSQKYYDWTRRVFSHTGHRATGYQ
jgi:hypothetical protein